MHKIIDDLNWRYATKKFDPQLKLTEDQLHVVMESMRLTASSYGLQAYKVLVIRDPQLREELVTASFGQRPVADASHLFVFCAATKVESDDVEAYMNRIVKTRKIPPSDLDRFSTGIKSSLSSMNPDDLIAWTTRQTYIALGQLMHTCASLRVDCLPMEGFDKKEYNRILGLDEQNLTATLVCPVGFRHAQDLAQHKKKVRKSTEDFFEFM